MIKFDPIKNALLELRVDLEAIVCPVGVDSGVILLSSDSPTVYDPELKIQVFVHEHFSPLGDALVALHQKLNALIELQSIGLKFD